MQTNGVFQLNVTNSKKDECTWMCALVTGCRFRV